MAAAAAALAMGIDRDAVREGLRSFAGVPHRLEQVAEIDGVRFVNDSKATNVASAGVGLRAFAPEPGAERSVHAILGGSDKGEDFGALVEPLRESATAVYLIGATSDRMAEELAAVVEDGVELHRCADLEDAVRRAASAARPADVVLLSPACRQLRRLRELRDARRALPRDRRGALVSSLSLPWPGARSKGARKGSKAKGKGAKKRARAAKLPPEYNMLLTATLCLLAFGAVMVFSASSTTKVLSDGGLSESAYYLKRTLLIGAVGLGLMHFVARRGLESVRRLTPLFLAGTFFLLVVVLFAGSSVNGSSRWIGSGFFQIQPSELAKVALVLYAADLLASKPKRVKSIEGLMPFLLVVGSASLLIVIEPDLGTALVVAFAAGAMLVAAGARMSDLAKIALVLGGLALALTVVEPYRMARLTGFLNPGADASGAGFQAAQAKIALGSGGIFGVGIGNGVQKAFYLPEAHTDMISAVIGEELGLVGIVGVVGLFALFGYAGLQVAKKAKDRYGKLLVAGLTSLIVVQATINLFAVMGMAPLTGVPLPFVSYGNSSLLATLFAVGLILNVARGGTARAGKLRVVDGGRAPAGKRSRTSSAKRRKSGGGNGGNRGSRGARHGGRRRASG